MKSDTPLDYAVFQLSPKHSRCELFVSRSGNTEKLASGLVKPFVTHLKVAEEQVAQAVHSIKLEVERHKNADTWFTKGTLERFVRFVSTPEVLEMVNTFDAEMSQLEGARKIYSQGTSDQLSSALGGDETGTVAAADATKKELLRAIDVRLAAVRQDLTTACARASAAGFNPETVSELHLFSDCFGARRLNEACTKFISVCERRPDLVNTWKTRVEDQVLRASCGSDMSIDDPTEDPNGPHDVKPHQSSFQNKQQNQQAGQEQKQPNLTQTLQHLNQSKPSTFHSSSSVSTQNENKEGYKKEESTTESLPSQPSQPARRLSVQDRINLFENKQKENSGGKPAVVGKSVELRRLSSDVSSAPEKAVLRRWSGASDMSIDLGNDKKDFNSADSPICTPSSSSVSQSKSDVFPSSSADYKDHKGLNDTVSSVKVEAKNVSGFKDQDELQTPPGGFIGKDEEVGLKGKVNWKDQVGSQPQLRAFAGRGEQVGVDQGVRDEKFKSFLGRDEKITGIKFQGGFDGKLRDYSDREETAGVNDQSELQTEVGNFVGKLGEVESGNRVEDVKVRDQPQSHSRFRGSHIHTRSLSGQFEGGFGGKVKEVGYKETESDQSTSQPQWKSSAGEVGEVGKKFEDLEGPRMKIQKPHSAGAEQVVKLQGRRDESGSNYGSTKFPSKKVFESQESFSTVPIPSIEQAQRIRQSKGNQELNDELKMKANELEKLFAEHKLRVPGDQSGSTRRSKHTELQVEQAISSQHGKPAAPEIFPVHVQDKKMEVEPILSAGDDTKFSTPPPMKMIDHQDYGSSLRQNFSELKFSDDSRGKFYERYMQKRDAKLREEWGTKRAEKEAKLKTMQDSLERSRAEMKAKFSGSADRLDSVSYARRREEKLRTFHSRSNIKREQNLVDSFQSEEEEDTSDILEQKYYRQDRSLGDAALMDSASRSSQNRKSFNRNLSSSTPRTSIAPVPRSSSKMSNPSSGRRRVQSENPLAQSVPNFSDFRKENTKPSSGVSKTANRMQVRNFARSKSTTEEIPLVKEEKPRRSQSVRKSSASPAEFKDLPTLNSDDVVLAPLKFDKDQTEQGMSEKFSKNVESKTFLRKGNGIGPGAGTSIAKSKASVASEALKNEDFEDSPFETEDPVNVTKEEEEEEEEEPELETTEVEDCANIENGKPRLSQESDKMSESENGDSLRSLSQIDPSSVAELPASVPSTFHAVGSLQDSPGESPVSWNSRMHNPFSYPHEISDIDASVDSPIGSPASWNPHSLTQTEADAARMRKKWGSAQKPILVANSSHNLARKDVTKGFKRLLKFGRKSRGTESLVDWISATTSEGDDDTEDGRDPANRSSEDLRKSRMGFSQNHPSDDGFNESELFNDQVAIHSSIPAPPENFKLRDDHMSGSSIKAPRSFFSLSSFRSKGSDSKLR
ncbi:uncharacterized protein LOC105631354 isoform X1 [Jatropha curcas]|uniref:uncharacterized protein LOC105631354 isoform X1 n=1 Tax=Jatropha curcas TaxID=180498 RepID=UPI0005FAA7CA|nr:uncharacterized protein LOC105631354 isoform X1 [Jatropha curcas]